MSESNPQKRESATAPTVHSDNHQDDEQSTKPVHETPDANSEDKPVTRPQIPGYEILEEIGRGGMGVVYKAKQTSLHRIVALKMVRDSVLADEKQRSRFRTEAAAVARLQHANIVQIFDLQEQAEVPFFSMEYVPGRNLAQYLQEKNTLPPQQAASLIEVLARAVHYAHQQGILHRDLKPANVLIEESEDISKTKITDFGLAKQLDVELTQTPTLSVMGTPSYMAPEQAEGIAELAPTLDVYSLGAILYETLTGKPPFDGDSILAILDKVRYEVPTSPRHLAPELPEALEAICLRCLQKDPAQRYANAAELAEDLQNFLAGRPLRAENVDKRPSEKMVAHYEIEKELARGGIWAVYQAKNRKTQETLALKRIRPGNAPSAEQLNRLRATIAIAQRLKHPNLVPYLDVGGAGEGFYFTMPLIEGVTLDSQVQDKAIPHRIAAELCARLADGLAHAHEIGLIHCHLDMSNVLLQPSPESESIVEKNLGKPTLLGFEMARRRKDKQGQWDLATIRPGSHAMAPEQLFNKPADIGPATDVYALGVLLYGLLTGRPPYQATTTSDLLLKVGFEILQAPHRLNNSVPTTLSRICMKCMQVEIGSRYASASLVAQDLRAFLEGRQTVADQGGFWSRLWARIRHMFQKPDSPSSDSPE